jgi:hypothetical protein
VVAAAKVGKFFIDIMVLVYNFLFLFPRVMEGFPLPYLSLWLE